jgi:hypothetical protein
MPTSVRLDAGSEALLRRLAHLSGRTKSDVLREALLRLSREHEALAPGDGPYTLVSDLVGIAHGGPDDLARRHKQAFRDKLASRSRE